MDGSAGLVCSIYLYRVYMSIIMYVSLKASDLIEKAVYLHVREKG